MHDDYRKYVSGHPNKITALVGSRGPCWTQLDEDHTLVGFWPRVVFSYIISSTAFPLCPSYNLFTPRKMLLGYHTAHMTSAIPITMRAGSDPLVSSHGAGRDFPLPALPIRAHDRQRGAAITGALTTPMAPAPDAGVYRPHVEQKAAHSRRMPSSSHT